MERQPSSRLRQQATRLRLVDGAVVSRGLSCRLTGELLARDSGEACLALVREIVTEI